jgi:hypothetical protein
MFRASISARSDQVTQTGNRSLRMQNHSRRHDRSGQRPASCLIDACDEIG